MTSLVNIDGDERPYPDQDLSAMEAFRSAWKWEGPLIAVNWAKHLADFRATAEMEKYDFLVGALDRSWITALEFEAAANGQWLPSFNDALPTDAIEAAKARGLFSITRVIRRSSPLLTAVANSSTIPITDRNIDSLFGYDGQYPD